MYKIVCITQVAVAIDVVGELPMGIANLQDPIEDP